MRKKLLAVLSMLAVGCYSGMGDSESDEVGLDFDIDTQETVDNLKLAGFPDQEIEVLEDGTVLVGSDAVVSLQASREMIEGLDLENGFRQYRTNNLVDTNAVSVICLNPSNAFASNGTLSNALDNAITNYNSRALQFTMQRNGGGCDANISIFLDNSGGGLSGFPSGGQPYSTVDIGQVVASYGVAVATHVIQHELGHCIGFRHTDFFDRSISCGGFPSNEGDGGVGAVHIPGTPTTNINANSSVMNACFSLAADGVWTSSDETALEFLYGTGGAGGIVYDVDVDTQTNQGASQGVETTYGPYDASNYDAIRFLMSGGSGDADLYVRFGSPPTQGSFDCRPFVGGNDETCEFNPAQNGSYYVMIRAYDPYSGVTLQVQASGGAPPPPPPPPPPPEVCDNGVDDDGDGDTDCADSDCSGDPACQAPPPPPPAEVCDNGVDDDGDGDTDCADSDCSGDPACQAPPPPEVCNNGVDDDGDGDTDCADSDCSGDPACQGGGLTELFFDDFEDGWGNFNDGGSDVRRSSSDADYAHSGEFCIRLRDNSGSSSAMFSDTFSIGGFSTLEIDFWYYARSMENGEDFFVELWDGGSWVVVGNFVRGVDFNNNSMNNEVITISSGDVNFSANARLRFRNDASNNGDRIYIDDVTVSAQ